jgi:hypothetical protein
MVYNCLNSLPTSTPSVLNSSVLSLQITSQHQQTRSIVSNSSSSKKIYGMSLYDFNSK